jgi:hypothetical protein
MGSLEATHEQSRSHDYLVGDRTAGTRKPGTAAQNRPGSGTAGAYHPDGRTGTRKQDHCGAPRRRRFAAQRLDGLYDEPRSGTPRRIGDDDITEVVRRTLEETPPDATHWSLRSMARAVGHAPSTIHRIWRAFGLQPHRSETFKLSSDPLFVDKVRDIVGLYLAPPDRALVLCVE